MRILFATNHAYLPQRVGGAEFSTHDLCQALESQGTSVTVLAALVRRGAPWLRYRIGRRLLGRQAARDQQPGYPVYRAPSPAAALDEVLDRCRPDVVIVHPDKAGDLIDVLQRRSQAALVYLRDAEFGRLGFVPRGADGLGYVANSHFTAAAARAAFGIEADVVPPLIQPDRYLIHVDGDEVLFVNPVPEKGVELAFEIAGMCPRRRFRFVEGWPLDDARWARLESRARDVGNVTLQRSTQDMRQVYARARVLIVPSRWQEAWGRIVTEAQLNGIPVLSMRIGGLPESVGSGGLLFDSEAPARAWADAIERVFEDAAHHAELSRLALQRTRATELAPATLVAQLLDAAHKIAHA